MLPLNRTGTVALREAWERLREGPSANPQLLAKVLEELEVRKRKPREVAPARRGSSSGA